MRFYAIEDEPTATINTTYTDTYLSVIPLGNDL
jgi:hypothetical protein